MPCKRGQSPHVRSYSDRIFQMRISSRAAFVELSLEGAEERIFEIEHVLENI